MALLSLYSLSLFLVVVRLEVNHFDRLPLFFVLYPDHEPVGILSTNTDDCMENHLNIINTSTWTVHLGKRGETSASHWGSKYVGPHIQIAELRPSTTNPQIWLNFLSSCTSPSVSPPPSLNVTKPSGAPGHTSCELTIPSTLVVLANLRSHKHTSAWNA